MKSVYGKRGWGGWGETITCACPFAPLVHTRRMPAAARMETHMALNNDNVKKWAKLRGDELHNRMDNRDC